jgi:hypothetical protein
MSSSGDPSPRGPKQGLWQGSKNEQKNCEEWDVCSMQWVRSKVNDLIEVHVWMYHEIYSEVVKMSSSGTLSKGGPKQGSLAGGPKKALFVSKHWMYSIICCSIEFHSTVYDVNECSMSVKMLTNIKNACFEGPQVGPNRGVSDRVQKWVPKQSIATV